MGFGLAAARGFGAGLAFGFADAVAFAGVVRFGLAEAAPPADDRFALRRVGRLSGRLRKTSWSPGLAGSLEAMAELCPKCGKRRPPVTAS
ncbi:MAG: hypothetical protein ACXVFN_04025 [Solirubrobacteraceae bacterium]